MADIFAFFGATEEASIGILLALIVEPILSLIGFLSFVLVSFWHYKNTKNKGALLVFISLLLSAFGSLLIEYMAADLDDFNYGIVEVGSRIFEASLFIVLVYGFYLVCKHAQTNRVANK